MNATYSKTLARPWFFAMLLVLFGCTKNPLGKGIGSGPLALSLPTVSPSPNPSASGGGSGVNPTSGQTVTKTEPEDPVLTGTATFANPFATKDYYSVNHIPEKPIAHFKNPTGTWPSDEVIQDFDHDGAGRVFTVSENGNHDIRLRCLKVNPLKGELEEVGQSWVVKQSVDLIYKNRRDSSSPYYEDYNITRTMIRASKTTNRVVVFATEILPYFLFDPVLNHTKAMNQYKLFVFDQNCSPIAPPAPLISTFVPTETYPAMDLADDGSTYLAWTEDEPYKYKFGNSYVWMSNNHYFFQILDSQGKWVGKPSAISPTVGVPSSSVSIAATPGSLGGAVLLGGRYYDNPLYLRRFDSTGKWLDTAPVKVSDGSDWYYSSNLVANAQGQFFIYWIKTSFNDPKSHIGGCVFSQPDKMKNFELPPVTQKYQFEQFSLTLLRKVHRLEGNFLLIWPRRKGEGSPHGVYLSQFRSDGTEAQRDALMELDSSASDPWSYTVPDSPMLQGYQSLRTAQPFSLNGKPYWVLLESSRKALALQQGQKPAFPGYDLRRNVKAKVTPISGKPLAENRIRHTVVCGMAGEYIAPIKGEIYSGLKGIGSSVTPCWEGDEAVFACVTEKTSLKTPKEIFYNGRSIKRCANPHTCVVNQLLDLNASSHEFECRI